MASARARSIVGLLKLGGQWLEYPGRQWLVWLQLLRYAYLLAGWLLNSSLVFSRGLAFLLTPTAVFLPLCLQVVSTTGVLLLYHREVAGVLAEGERVVGGSREPWEAAMLSRDSRTVRRLAALLHYGLNSFAAVYILGPLLLDAVLRGPEPYLLPLPLDGLLPPRPSRSLHLYLVVFAADLWFLFGVPNTVSYECLIFYAVSYTTSEIKILKKRIRLLYARDDGGVHPLPDWDLSQVIRRHQNIIRLNGLQRKYITLPYMIQYVVSTLSFCFIMFLLNQMIGKDTVISILGGIFIIMVMCMVFIMCYAGESVSRLIMNTGYSYYMIMKSVS